jgi:hypothetical protein
MQTFFSISQTKLIHHYILNGIAMNDDFDVVKYINFVIYFILPSKSLEIFVQTREVQSNNFPSVSNN